MNRTSAVATILLFLIIFCSCTDEWRRGKGSKVWNSTAPTSIPYNIRMKEFKSGNLVANPSFEEGTPLSSDTSTVQTIKKWEIIGNNVRYIENRQDSNYVYAGTRAICILRNEINETAILGDGVLSDFIPVIPGKYDLSLLLKGNNIQPYKERLGTRLHDAINIRLIFYDDQKSELSPEMVDPTSGSSLDMGFKSHNFAGNYSVDIAEWTRIHTRSCDNPMMDGLLPAGSRYVRIFIGLKGTGTLMIDDVQFSYSLLNFTAKERMNRVKDSVPDQNVLLIPTPQYVEFRQSIPLITAGSDNVLYPAVILDVPQTPQNLHAMEILSDTLTNILSSIYPDCQIKTQNGLNKAIRDESSVIFILTSFEHIDTISHSAYLPGFSTRDQAYVIIDSIINGKHHIILAANDDPGLYYAVLTIADLLDRVSGLLHIAHIIDYPAFTNRAFLYPVDRNNSNVESDPLVLQYFASNRFNIAYITCHFPDDTTDTFINEHHTIDYQNQLQRIKKDFTFLSPGLFLKLFPEMSNKVNSDTVTDPETQSFSYNEKMLQELFNFMRPLMEKGISHIMFYDQSVALNANVSHVMSIYKWVQQHFPGTMLEIFSHWNTNESIIMSRGLAEAYYNRFASFEKGKISFVWSGITYHFPVFDPVDFNTFSELANHKTIIFNSHLAFEVKKYLNNTNPSLYSGQVRLLNIFSPFFSARTSLYPETLPQYVINSSQLTEIDKIRIHSIADFLWNPARFQPEISLWKILIKKYGIETALRLVEFNDVYTKVLENILKLEQDTKEQKSLLKTTMAGIKKLDSLLSEMQNAKSTELQVLINELQFMSYELDIRINSLSELQYVESNEPK
jgi:hypothetical protein